MLPPSGQIRSLLTYHIARSSSFTTFVPSLLYSSAWLTGYEHPVIDTINQRIEDLTGLEMDTAEELQVKSSLAESCKYLLFFLTYYLVKVKINVQHQLVSVFLRLLETLFVQLIFY